MTAAGGATAAQGSTAAVASAKVNVPLAYDQRADAAAAAVLRRLLGVIRADIPGAIDGGDPEHLHQLRIAIRRSRTVQRQLRRAFPPGELAGFRSEFRWLQRATGDARDLDVQVEEFEALRGLLPEDLRAAVGPLRPVLVHGRMAARAEMGRALRSGRTEALLADWERLLETLVELPVEDRPDAERCIGELAGERIRRVYRRIVRMGRAIDASSPAAEYHELRKKTKELRYLLDLFGARLFGEERVGPMVKALKGLQDVLGRHQDREVQVRMLRESAGEVAGLRGGAAACVAIGGLAERLRVDAQEARVEFRQRFGALASGEQRRLVKRTFSSAL